MKRLIIAFVVILAIQSCTKQDNDEQLGTIELKVNGKDLLFKNTSDLVHSASFYRELPGQFSSTTKFIITGNDASNPNGEQNLMAVYFDTDTLKIGTYVLDINSGGIRRNVVKIDTASYVVNNPGDQLTFNITSVTADRLTATFSGKMSRSSGGTPGSIIITDGKVNNLKVRR